jgi:hypothetical protein
LLSGTNCFFLFGLQAVRACKDRKTKQLHVKIGKQSSYAALKARAASGDSACGPCSFPSVLRIAGWMDQTRHYFLAHMWFVLLGLM